MQNSIREAVIEMSRRLGFLTGMESEIMLEAHVQAGFVVGLPFAKRGGYDFGSTNKYYSEHFKSGGYHAEALVRSNFIISLKLHHNFFQLW